MSLKAILDLVTSKDNFQDLNGFNNFCVRYLEFIQTGLQATIVSQNEKKYSFFQYKADGAYQITRPINSLLMYNANNFENNYRLFVKVLGSIEQIDRTDFALRQVINQTVYTIQQSIGAALDALPAGKSNQAKKMNGDLFERLIRLIIIKLGLDCKAETIRVPIIIDGVPAFNMNYHHDLVIYNKNEIKLIGSVKTSSKDRIDKIFIEKFLYNKLADLSIPHIAIFQNDVQRKKTKRENEFGINSTFLTGHFKAYTLKLSPLDGVYYADILPAMQTEPVLATHIKTLDKLILDDIWQFV